MICKYDWSASNMLVRSNEMACTFDFDTAAYPGARLSFFRDVLRSESNHLDWPAVPRPTQLAPSRV